LTNKNYVDVNFTGKNDNDVVLVNKAGTVSSLITNTNTAQRTYT